MYWFYIHTFRDHPSNCDPLCTQLLNYLLLQKIHIAAYSWYDYVDGDNNAAASAANDNENNDEVVKVVMMTMIMSVKHIVAVKPFCVKSIKVLALCVNVRAC